MEKDDISIIYIDPKTKTRREAFLTSFGAGYLKNGSVVPCDLKCLYLIDRNGRTKRIDDLIKEK